MGSGDVFGWDGVVGSSLPTGVSPRGGESGRVLNIARGEIGVKELTGKNDGVRIEQYLKYTGLPKGHAWCASFVSWVFGQAGYKQPRTAWSPALFPASKLVKVGKPGDVIGIYFKDLGRIAHVGLVEMDRGNYIQTIEGNTASDGGRDGNAVHRRLRLKKTISKYADWL
ncbi:CHAP domain-containing protein [Pedobacter frigoris]|uniref:CHAP domain-containing protein n=1 Tax=Pedobacter frigoris TaxID=2571272 RepID=UPI002931D3D6|nr:CHAP domain-containing protein [Pedobacter frigoris]